MSHVDDVAAVHIFDHHCRDDNDRRDNDNRHHHNDRHDDDDDDDGDKPNLDDALIVLVLQRPFQHPGRLLR